MPSGVEKKPHHLSLLDVMVFVTSFCLVMGLLRFLVTTNLFTANLKIAFAFLGVCILIGSIGKLTGKMFRAPSAATKAGVVYSLAALIVLIWLLLVGT